MLLMALVVSDAIDTPYFDGMEGDVLAKEMINVLDVHMQKFYEDYANPEWSEDNVFEYLSERKEFKVDHKYLKSVYETIKERN